MTDETLNPIFKEEPPESPKGRIVDLLAAILSGIGASLSILAALWFFLGFAENDTRLEHLTSAFFLTVLLFAFAIIPFCLVGFFAWQAHLRSTKRAHLLWTLCLMLPWVGLGTLVITHTPLPLWCGLVVTGLASLLSLWALISAVLDGRSEPSNTTTSQQNEMLDSQE